ncbi:TRAP transporter substrate-binding protein [Rubrobacter taiwanensis]|uniref:TRAP transporter substrate-binding protein n=1 Tax=Rubrobacter taiwanensis TaxID=185139 RepID=UPI001A9FF3FA|nr:TRAP transporter substrate-binding protein [Rubrobacter taiwanensis]
MLRKWRFILGLLVVSAVVFAAACGDFGGQPAGQEEEAAGDEGTAVADEPELTPPPEIEGEVITGDLGEYTINFGIGLSETSPQYRSVEYFRDILEERTEGRLQVRIFPNSQVGDDLQMMNALQSGTLEMTYPSTSPATGIVPELAVFDLPFLFPSPEAADEVLDSELGQEMLDRFDGTGIKALAFAENGYRQLTNSQRPVESPDDVRGLDLRVMENPIQVDIWRTLGANPTSMAFGEVFSAMEQGVVDGQENPWSTILTSNFYEVQGYGSETRHVYTPFIIMISEQFWNELPGEYQELIQEAAEKTRDYQRIISREYDQWSKERLRDEGMEITELTDEQRREFEEAVQPVYDRWAPEIGEELVERVQEMVAEFEER